MAKLVDILMEADRYADVKKVTMLKKVPVPGKNKYLKENWYKKLRGKDNSLTDSIQDRISFDSYKTMIMSLDNEC